MSMFRLIPCLALALAATRPTHAADPAPDEPAGDTDRPHQADQADQADQAPDERRTVVRPPPGTPATSILDRERLAEKAGVDLPAALSGEPGLHLPRLGGLGSYATVRIRGSTPEQVLVTLDGIPLNPADGAPVDLSTLPVGPLSHVAIHRGRTPWSLGLTGLGGAIRLETAPTAEPTTSGELALGSFATRVARAHAGLSGLSVAVDHLGTDADFRFLDDGGTAWTTDDDRTSTRQNAQSLQTSAFVRGDSRLGPFTLTAIDLFTHVDRGLPSLGVTPTRSSNLEMARNLIALRLTGPIAELGPSGPVHLALTTSLATASTTVADPRNEIGLAGDETTTRTTAPHATASLGLPLGEVYLTTHFSLRHEAVSTTPHDALTPHTDLSRTLGSAAFEAHWRAPAFQLATGIRLERGPDLTGPSAFFEAALPLGSTRLHAALHHTPRLPSLFERHGNLGLVLGNPDLVAERQTALELGLRLDSTSDDHRAHLVLLAHGAFADDLIQYLQNAQGISRPENLASARILGLELAGELHLGEHLSLRSSLALLDARDTSDIAARSGQRLPLRPSFTTTHRLELRLPEPDLGASGALGLALDLDHLSGNTLDAANLVVARPRTLIGASAWVRSERIEVRASLMNLTESTVNDLSGYPLPGLTALVAFRWLTP